MKLYLILALPIVLFIVLALIISNMMATNQMEADYERLTDTSEIHCQIYGACG